MADAVAVRDSKNPDGLVLLLTDPCGPAHRRPVRRRHALTVRHRPPRQPPPCRVVTSISAPDPASPPHQLPRLQPAPGTYYIGDPGQADAPADKLNHAVRSV
ncbi:DUF397 domain-containing protein [Actinomadura citrea]|uniref:DUF397 domain-containing protein n=1 Tax=Actinomadura citrea TaxID=46158 RepID=UPI0019B52715|nr:hypothetical protein GCM10010177_29290 [Actinomadura citrea]